MKKVYFIFDYFKEAFHVNRDNKRLYRPQIALISIKLLLILLMGLRVYSWIGTLNILHMNERQVLSFLLTHGLILILLLSGYGIASVFVESGLYNMYKKCILSGSIQNGDFTEGVRKYFFKFLLGEIIITLAWIILSPLYILLGIVTLFLGFALIPMIVSIFLTMWKVSMVMNDMSIFKALADSFRFAKENFLPLTVLQLIHWAFVKGASSGRAGNFNTSGFRFNNGGRTPFSSNPFNKSIDWPRIVDTGMKVIKTGIAVLIPAITIAALVGSLIRMVFEIFFSLSLFIAYNKRFIEEDKVSTEEVVPDVV